MKYILKKIHFTFAFEMKILELYQQSSRKKNININNSLHISLTFKTFKPLYLRHINLLSN